MAAGKQQVLRFAQDDNSFLDAAQKTLAQMATNLSHYRIFSHCSSRTFGSQRSM